MNTDENHETGGLKFTPFENLCPFVGLRSVDVQIELLGDIDCIDIGDKRSVNFKNFQENATELYSAMPLIQTS